MTCVSAPCLWCGKPGSELYARLPCHHPGDICAFCWGYHFAWEVLGGACPTCGIREVASGITYVDPFRYVRVLVQWAA